MNGANLGADSESAIVGGRRRVVRVFGLVAAAAAMEAGALEGRFGGGAASEPEVEAIRVWR